MKNIKLKLFSLLLALTFSSIGYTLDLGTAKAQGLVGETTGGYLGAVVPGAEVDQLIQSINSQRQAQYQSIAQSTGTSVQNVETIAGQKAIARTAPGHYVNTGGGWAPK
jgi:uncharacterized protein YdbL (DUF1318 family)